MTIRTLEGTTVHDIVVAASQFCEDIHLNRAAMHKLNEACSHSPSMQPTSARIPYRRGRGTQTRGNIMVRAVDDMMDIIIRPD